MKKLILLLLLSLPVAAQLSPPSPRTAAADPASCSTTGAWYQKFYYNTASNVWKYCSAANTWTAFGAAQAAPFTTGTANPAASGVLRCANNETCVAGRDSTNAVDLTFKFDSSNLGNFSVGLTAPSYTSSGSNGGVDFTNGTGGGLTPAAAHCVLWGDSSYNIFLKYNCNNSTSQALGAPDPTVIKLEEEFIGGTTSTNTIGALGWNAVNNINTHAGTIGSSIGVYPNLGQITLSTAGTAQGDGLNIYLSNSQPPSGDMSAHTNWMLVGVWKVTSTSNPRARFGLADTVTGCQAANDIVVRFDTNAGFGDTNYTFETGAASAYTAQASAVAANTSFHTFRIWSTTIGEILFSVDGGASVCFTAAAAGGCAGAGSAVHSAHIPTVSMTPNFTMCTDTASSRIMNIDYFAWFETGLTR